MGRKTLNSTFKPDFTKLKLDDEAYKTYYYQAMSYLRTEIDGKTLKANALKWLKKNTEYDLTEIKSLPDWRFDTLGKLCFIMNHNGEIPETGAQFIANKMVELYGAVNVKIQNIDDTTDTETAVTNIKKSIQDHVKEQTYFMVGLFEEWIDNIISNEKYDINDLSPVTTMRLNNVKQVHARHIIKVFEARNEEIDKVINKSDSDLVEGYSKLSKKQLKSLSTLYSKIIDGCGVIIGSAKAQKKPRKKKAIDKTKLVSKLKLQKEDVSLGISSINPVDILGSSEIWVYNTKNRKIGRYVSFDQAGLMVKNSSILNYSKDKSTQKTLRKPVEQIKEFKKATAKSMTKIYDEIKSVDVKMNGRINDTMVIFRVFK